MSTQKQVFNNAHLRERMIDIFEALQNGKITYEKAREQTRSANTILKSAALGAQYGGDTAFFTPTKPA